MSDTIEIPREDVEAMRDAVNMRIEQLPADSEWGARLQRVKEDVDAMLLEQ